MLSIRKRQSGRLARLILEHCRATGQYELRAAAPFPEGIEPPCVAVIDLDEVTRDIVGNEYSTQVDFHGLMCLLMLFETLIAFTMHVFWLSHWSWLTWNWADAVFVNLILCVYAVFRGDGTLTLARRSDTSCPGYVALLDQEFTVVLNGSQSIVEAIAESSFNLSHPSSVCGLSLGVEDRGQDSPYDSLEALCEGAGLIIFVSCWLLFWPSTTLGLSVSVFVISDLLQRPPDHFTPLQVARLFPNGVLFRYLPPALFVMAYVQTRAVVENPLLWHPWQRYLHFLTVVLLLAGYRTRNYPIRSGKLLDALGNPLVRKWQFDTLAAAATFQCLVLCRGISRPIRDIDVFAFLDMLVPDQRVVQKAWKERVADRIVHEPEADICFAPTIPTFGDERQQQLKKLLDQAQLGYRKYRHSYG
ncbi:hypothetical protein HD554DRAFT_2174536 [Boletus coccyginus]|nr:hypothetical protein HD554DRAFT_2174536 [Boletus coccyginus]